MAYQAAVITVSDKGSTGERVDTSGPAVRAMLEGAGYQVIHTAIVPDDKLQIGRELTRCADELGCDLVLTTGGTGLSPRDVTPEATRAVLHREIPAIPQAMLYAHARTRTRTHTHTHTCIHTHTHTQHTNARIHTHTKHIYKTHTQNTQTPTHT